MPNRVYLDWNATTPLRPEARSAMIDALDCVGNASSVHAEGRAARRLMEDAREIVAMATGAKARNVVFTSGGTEANAMALTPQIGRTTGFAPLQRLIASAIEHPSVLAGGRFAGEAIDIAPVTPQGVIDLAKLEAMLAGGPPALVSIMLANNETGVVQPVAEVAALVHQAGGVLHVDAVQAFGKIPFNINELNFDLATISAHKIGGPKGVGALILAEGLLLSELLVRGGGQERGFRAGTENVVGIAGFGAAVTAAMRSFQEDVARIARLRAELEAGLRQVPGTVIFGESEARLPNTVLVAAPGMKAETAVIGFDLGGIAVSSGSACSSGKVQPSHVLLAMQVPVDLVGGAIRITLGWETTGEDVVKCIDVWKKLTKALSPVSENIAV